ncbi:MAG: alpha-amylase family glycosyl hydrolase [Brevinematia bacterium]
MHVLIYNLFPRLAGNFREWMSHLDRIKEMGFNWIYLNPFQYSGFSGSLYAIKDYFSLNPIFIDEKSNLNPFEQLKQFLDSAHKFSIKVAMDLLINHTAKDHPFTEKYPFWYKRNEKGEIKSPGAWDNGRWVEWGDLAEINNETNIERERLWNYWLEVISFYSDMGFDGFRADAAYAVPQSLWEFLISKSKAKNKNLAFFAESLGCPLEKTIMLAKAGFDFIFNSSKWWNYKDSWLIDQYRETKKLVPSISFPESHDTDRLYKESRNELEFKQRLIFTCFFSTGWMIPIGLEYGFTKKLDVCKTTPFDWERTGLDFTDLIKKLINIKLKYRILHEEGEIENFVHSDEITLLIKKSNKNDERVLFLINTSLKKKKLKFKKFNLLFKTYKDILSDRILTDELELSPFDIRVLLT